MTEFGSRGESAYAALIGDVVDSRKSPNRKELQKCLLVEIRKLNKFAGKAFLSPLALTAGDEVQVVLNEPEKIVDIVVGLSDAVAPETLIFGLGYGALSTEVDPNVARMDGPCLHRARAALREAQTGGMWLAARGFGEAEDRIISSLLNLIFAVRGRWTSKQRKYAQAARTKPQKDVAAEFGRVPATVSESLKAAFFSVVLEGEKEARRILENFGSRAEFALNSVRDEK